MYHDIYVQAMQERDVTTGRWAQEQLQRGHELLLQQQQKEDDDDKEQQEEDTTEETANADTIIPAGKKELARTLSDKESKGVGVTVDQNKSNSDGVLTAIVAVPSVQKQKTLQGERSTDDFTKEPIEEGNKELKKAFTVNSYFEFLVDGELMSKAYALKEVVASCDRITQWVHLNQKWADCLEFMENKLSQYNMAVCMCWYLVSSVYSHIVF
jgi:hypothetical protein